MLRRDRLVHELRSQEHCSVISIAAPAGYGKTSIAALWAENTDLPVGWLTLDPDDNDFELFTAGLIAAVRTIDPQACRRAEATLANPATAARAISNDLDEIGRRFAIVFDDFHVLDNPTVLELMATLIVPQNRSLCAVLVGRAHPPLRLESMRASGLVHDVTAAMLRFTTDETSALLTKNSAVVDHEIRDVVETDLEGWPAGVGLAARALAIDADRDPVGILARYRAAIDDYLSEEVLRGLPEQRRLQLMYASLPGFFSESACVRLFEHEHDDGAKTDAAEFASWVERAQLFCHRSATNPDRLRFHPAFRRRLLNDLTTTVGRARLLDLQRGLAEWYQSRGLVAEALDHAMRAEAPQLAVRIVVGQGVASLFGPERTALAQWLKQLPRPQVEAEPILRLYEAWVEHSAGRAESALALLDTIAPQIPRTDSGKPHEPLALWTALRAEICRGRGEFTAAREWAKQAQSLFPVEQRWGHAFTVSIDTLARQGGGDSAGAIAAIESALVDPTLSDRDSQRMLLSTHARLVVDQIDLRQQRRLALRMRDLESPGRWMEGRVRRAIVHYQQGEFSEAAETLDDTSSDWCALSADVHSDAATVAALCSLRRNDWAAAERIHQSLADYAIDEGSSLLADAAAALSAEIDLRRKRPSRARAWADRFVAPEHACPGRLFPPELSQLRVWSSVEADLPETKRSLERQIRRSRQYGSVLLQLQLGALEAGLIYRAGERQTARAKLEELVAKAERLDAVTVLSDQDPLASWMPALLRETDDHTRPFVIRLERCCGAPLPSRSGEATRESAGTRSWTDQLTNREVDVLELLLKRLQNREIAEALHVSNETVKSHLKSIYKKAGTRSRRETISLLKDANSHPLRR